MKKNQAEDSYTHQKMVNWENQAVTSYDFSILCQRSGDIDGSISLLQQAQNTQDDRINTATSTMKDFLDAAVCDWSNGLRTWHPLLKPNLTHSYDTDTFNHDGLQILLNTEPKIKVGYVYDAKCSSDIMKIPHMHDLSKFEVFYYPINFHQTYGVADRIFKDNIYLLVLLDESPFSVFDEIFCLRPAPVQISFNLHVTRNIDYFITHDKSSCVASKAIYMPSAFIDIELYNMIPHRASDSIANLRSKYEISEDSFVYASFSQPYKIDEVTFNVWMNILKSTCESSLLLLIRHNGQMEANLKMEAEQRGVNPKRLLFMESCAKFEEHLERYSLVDVFLDTVTHSSKRLICEAVLSGTPMICYNQATEFCNFGQSILGNIGLEDQIVTSLEQYEKLAVGLQFDEEKFIDIVRRLDDKRSSEVGIFNTHSPSRWISSFEQALQSVVER
jgi:predicted O-linked N-acetylglucosamine transferase (SPINDLY family)